MANTLDVLDYEGLSPSGEQRIIDVCRRFDAGWGQAPYEIHERKIKPALALPEGSRLVEVGVGIGIHLCSYVNFDYVGFDTDYDSIKKAREFAEEYRMPNVRLAEKRDWNSVILPVSVDGIFSVCTLHEIENIESELDDMHSALKPEGRIVIVERMCAICEKPIHINSLKKMPETLSCWFDRNHYTIEEQRFRATYWGASLSAEPSFSFYMFCGQKPKKA